MYQFKEEWDRVGHFWFDKKLIENKNWAALPLASKSVYPVIACHRNDKGEAFPGEQTIAILSGCTDKTVRKGIKHLEDFPDINIFNYVTKRGKRSKKFLFTKPPKEPGRAFPFYKEVFETGNWLHLIPSAQALYPVMRHFGFFDEDVCMLYADIEDESFDSTCWQDYYPSRKWEFCEATPDVLADYAGITKRSIHPAINSLEEHFLIKRYSDENWNGWKVYLHPPKYYARAYLNQLIMDKYKHLNAA